jgi:hypothetical protein
MIFIAHRGNLYGPNRARENHPDTIEEAISLGFHCEIDVWAVGKDYFLGHDFPQYPIDIDFLEKYRDFLWVHCKNLRALSNLKDINNCFFHDKDLYTLTSSGFIWGNINTECDEKSICVMPELGHHLTFNAFGICTDFSFHFRDLYYYHQLQEPKKLQE